MSYVITNQCIGCDRCRSSCPTQAVQREGDRYWIDVSQCDGCEGMYRVPQCWAACPTNSGCTFLADIPISLSQTPRTGSSASPLPDYWDTWFDTYDRLVQRLKRTQTSDYWHRWFDTYSTTLARLQSNSMATSPVG